MNSRKCVYERKQNRFFRTRCVRPHLCIRELAKDEEKEEARLLPYCGGVKPLTYCRLAWPASTMADINGLIFRATKAVGLPSTTDQIRAHPRRSTCFGV